MILQIVLAVVSLSWNADSAANGGYKIYRAPLLTSFAVNEDGLSIPTDFCGQWRLLGNSSYPSAKDVVGSKGLTPGRWCYAVRSVHVDTGIDAVTGLPLAPITSLSELSDVVIVEIP